MKLVTWECRDCALGEIRPCKYEALQEDPDSIAVSCPLGTCGEDAKWIIVSSQDVERI